MSAKHRGDETHQRIASAAIECFAAQGYDATGVAEICERAGVTKGAFYHHFPSKQALFLDILEQWLSGLDARLAVALAGAETVPQGLQRMVEATRQVFEGAGGQIPIFLEFWSKASRDPVVWQATIDPYRRYRAFLAGLIEAGVAEGSLSPVDPEAGAHVLLSLAVGLLLQGLLDPHGADWAEVAQQCLAILMAGLEAN